MDKTIAIGFWFVITTFWSLNIWGGWAEKMYERWKDENYIWYWLRALDKPINKENCIKFIKSTSWLGLALSTFGTLAVLVLNQS
jgi:hypothetical protein